MTEKSFLPPYLTDAEIADICAPLVVPGYQIKYLQRLGLIVNRKPNGKPLVARGEFDRVLVGRQPEVPRAGAGQPIKAALMELLDKRKPRKSSSKG
jgi:hypothetical protein